MPRFLHILSILILFSSFLIQSPAGERENNIIKEIRFHGLKRTRNRTALNIILPVAPGETYSPETDESIIQKLRETGIFNPEIRVETCPGDAGILIDVYVRDKWTLVPIPFAAFSKDGSWSGGLMGIEHNLLGLNKTLGGGVFFGSFGWSGLGFYRDPRFLGRNLSFSTSVKGGVNDVEILNPDEETILEYKENILQLRMGIEYPFSEQLSIKGEGRFDHSEMLTGPADNREDSQSMGPGGRILWQDLYYDIPYCYGFYAETEGWAMEGLNGSDSYQVLKGEIYRAFNPFYRHQLKFAVKGARGFHFPAREQFLLGGGRGSFTLPGDQAAEQYLMAWAAYGMPLLSFPWGTLAFRTLYEAGVYESEYLEREFYHGPGAGIEIYLNDIAFPAFMLTAGWNLKTGRYQIAAGIGLGRE